MIIDFIAYCFVFNLLGSIASCVYLVGINFQLIEVIESQKKVIRILESKGEKHGDFW